LVVTSHKRRLNLINNI